MTIDEAVTLYSSEWVAFLAVNDQEKATGRVVAHAADSRAFDQALEAVRKEGVETYHNPLLHITFVGPAEVPEPKDPDGFKHLAQSFVSTCRECGTECRPRVRWCGTSAEYAHYRVEWACACGAHDEKEIGYDWGEITILDKGAEKFI